MKLLVSKSKVTIILYSYLSAESTSVDIVTIRKQKIGIGIIATKKLKKIEIFNSNYFLTFSIVLHFGDVNWSKTCLSIKIYKFLE